MTTPPDARTEYSRARAVFPAPGTLLAGAALLGAALLAVAEFTPLYSVHYVTSARPAGTVSAGHHNSYALLPIALLSGALAVASIRRAGRHLHLALATLGLIALLIALLGDLPDASTSGLTRHYVLAATTPRAGLYLETAGAIVLLGVGGAGLLRAWPGPGRRAGLAAANAADPAGGVRSGS